MRDDRWALYGRNATLNQTLGRLDFEWNIRDAEHENLQQPFETRYYNHHFTTEIRSFNFTNNVWLWHWDSQSCNPKEQLPLS
jgi:hypothetical protein